MNEKTIEFAVPGLLPGVTDESDRRIERLEAALRALPGVLRVHLENSRSPVGLCLHYDSERVGVNDVAQMAKRASHRVLNRYRWKTLFLEGMDCSDCAVVIEHRLSRLDGVLDVNVNYAEKSVQFAYDTDAINQRQIEKRIRQLGYLPAQSRLVRWYNANRELLFSVLSGIALLAGWAGQNWLGLAPEAGLALYLAAYVLGGFDVTRHSLHTLRRGRLDTHLLMLLAALGAASLGNLAEGALLLFLFSLGHALEERVLDRARNAVRLLADLAPKTALVRRSGTEVEIPVEQLTLGDIVVVRPGVRIPSDGEVAAGRSAVDQSAVTGESLPVEKVPGERVFASSVNGDGVLDVRVTRLAQDSTLARIMKMVEQAQEQKAPTQQVTERFTRVYVPVVLAAALLLILIPPLFGIPFAESFRRAMTLLVAASPCALALGTPSAILAGVAQAARNGVLVKGGAHLENLGRLRALAFDKTGTLTQGAPKVTDVWAVEGETQSAVLALAAALERRSAHPLAQAIWQASRESNLAPSEAVEVEALTGLGVRAKVNGQEVLAGSYTMVVQAGWIVPDEALGLLEQLEAQGKTVVWVGREGRLAGLVALADTARPNARRALAALEQIGVKHTVMLSGDNPRAAAHMADQLGLREFRAGLLPADKLAVMNELVRTYQVVGMVGDGVNDAPALASATVGIAMGGAATDVALETADVALMGNDLEKLSFAIGLGRATRRVILQNLVLALGVILVLVVLALTGLAGIGVAVVFHEGSTLLVALNALRLLAYRPGPALQV